MSTASTSLEVRTLEQLLLRIEETKPILTANVDETEANRRIAQANIDALTEAGVFKVTVPRRFGGYEMFIPMSELLIKETWFVAGMKGTGSNTIIADKVFVPEHRRRSVPQALQNEYATEHTDEALYRSSFIPVLTLILAGPQLGLGRAALRFVTDKAPKRGIAYTKFERQIDSTAFQLQIANAATLIDTAHLHAYRAAADIDDAAAAGEKPSYLSRARVRADTAYAITKIREAIDALLSAHGRLELRRGQPAAAHLARCQHRRAPGGRRPAGQSGGLRQSAAGHPLRGQHHAADLTAGQVCRTWWAKRTASAPSLTAPATRFVAPARTSPAAKTPGQTVSSRCG